MKIKIIFVFFILVLFFSGCNSLYWKEKIEIKCVKDKWIKSSSENQQKYLVGMKQGEVYQITDSFFKWQFRSSDIYNQIEKDKCYRINSFGFRSGFFSVYRTIYNVEEVRESEIQ